MFISFSTNKCPKHNLPVSIICDSLSCNCSGFLCQKCGSDHLPNKDGLLQDSTYLQKKQIEIQLILKEFSKYEKYCQPQKGNHLLCSTNQDNIQCVEGLLRSLKQEKKRVFFNLEDFIFNHVQVKKKLNKLQELNPGSYLISIKNINTTEIAGTMLSEVGLERMRKRILSSRNINQKYLDFINAVRKYGSNYKEFLEGMGFQNKKLIINKILEEINIWKGNRPVEVCTELFRYKNRNKEERSKQRIQSQSPRRRVNVFTGKVYRVESEKQN